MIYKNTAAINALILIGAFLFVSCSFETDQPGSVATWNGHSIPEDLFVTEYVRYTSSAPIRDNMEMRKQIAKILLERDIISSHAEKLRLDTLRHVANAEKRAEELALIKYYLRSELKPDIYDPTEDDLREAFQRSNTEAELEHIFTRTEEEILQVRNLLDQGHPFDSLAAQSMRNAGQPAESYKLGWVRWNQIDLTAEKAAFSLDVGEISEPVRSSRGWHIFRSTDKKETFFADGTTYRNSKESLGFALERRQYEEKSPVYVDSELGKIELVTNMENLGQLWNYLAPRLPNTRNEIVMMMNREAAKTDYDDLPGDTPLALVDGEPFTVSQFLERLPNIPMPQLGPNLRTALETTIRDSIFSARAVENGFADHPDVIKETRITRTEAQYDALLSRVADTLQLEPIKRKWYGKWKDQFIRRRDLQMQYYAFDDSLRAQQALSRYVELGNWREFLAEFEGEYETFEAAADDSLAPMHPGFFIHERLDDQEEMPLWGPHKLDDKWVFFKIDSRTLHYRDLAEVEEDLMENMKRRLSEVVHHEKLEQLGYHEDEIEYHEDVLHDLLPFYF